MTTFSLSPLSLYLYFLSLLFLYLSFVYTYICIPLCISLYISPHSLSICLPNLSIFPDVSLYLSLSLLYISSLSIYDHFLYIPSLLYLYFLSLLFLYLSFVYTYICFLLYISLYISPLFISSVSQSIYFSGCFSYLSLSLLYMHISLVLSDFLSLYLTCESSTASFSFILILDELFPFLIQSIHCPLNIFTLSSQSTFSSIQFYSFIIEHIFATSLDHMCK
ncbi:unnamed protein product [Acanthosepion pharaonis]|uniref:Uncharacterized protein n=1 Tax=Acanthosepion pharaonis TaxID=158019 RepID=A0A812DT84_ACAPH|nr:unnamed protein product [Sepia pharaonis]